MQGGEKIDFNWSLADWESHSENCRRALESLEDWKQIPLLNVAPNHELKDQQLVRFRGMIQHMHNPEYFLGQYEVEHNITKEKQMRSGRYRDILQCSADERLIEASDNVMEERQVFYCITIPALNDWVAQEDIIIEKQRRRSTSSASTTPVKSTKRCLEESQGMDVDESPSVDAKRVATKSIVELKPGGSQPPTLNLNFPIDGASGMACLVKMYECDNHSSLKLNDVVEVVGFLSVDPRLGVIESEEPTDMEKQTQNPSPSAVPRLHAIHIRKLVHSSSVPTDLGSVFESAESARKELNLVLTQVLLGDALAADYLICHLISIVYMRKDGLALGHLSLNLSNMPHRSDYTRLLYSILQRLLPKSHYLAMTLDNMNTLSLIPKMDYEANRLSSGLLQLSDNTHLIVDETRLETGKLDTVGVKNVQALSHLISQQSVNYDFQYYTKPYDADIPVLILSEGKSLLPSDVLVPLQPDPTCLNTVEEIFQAARHFLREPLLTSIRIYLAAMRHASYEFPEDLQKRAQDDFVEMRRINGQQVTADDLHLLLVLAKLISLSCGEQVVTQTAWEKAKAMEQGRKARLGSQNDRVEHQQGMQPSNEP